MYGERMCVVHVHTDTTFFGDDSVKIGGVMTNDQVPMTEVGRLMATESWLVTKPHQVIVPPSGEWKLIAKLHAITICNRNVWNMCYVVAIVTVGLVQAFTLASYFMYGYCRLARKPYIKNEASVKPERGQVTVKYSQITVI